VEIPKLRSAIGLIVGFQDFSNSDFGTPRVKRQSFRSSQLLKSHEERKVEVSGEKGLVFGISGFEGRRGKALDNRIHELVKSDIPKRKGESPNVSWVLIVEFMPVQRSHEHNSEGPVT
jgi:hypothetical protein